MSDRSFSKTAARAPIAGLDGLRAVAITMVFFYHAWGHSGFPDASASFLGVTVSLAQVLKSGTGGVSIFFVLSGFLLSHPFWQQWLSTGPTVDIRRYVGRRIIRLYPAYLLAIAIYALFHDVAHPLWIRAIHVVSHLLLIHNFAEATISSLSAPLWMLGTLFQLYLLMPVIFILLGSLPQRLRVRYFPPLVVFIGGGLVAISFMVAANFILSTIPLDPRLVRVQGSVIPNSPLVGLAYFSAGIAAGYLYIYLKRSRGVRAQIQRYFDVIAVGVFVAIFLRLLVSPEQLGFGSIGWPMLPLLYGSLVLAISLGNPGHGVPALLEFAPIKYIGLVSYSFYLYHDFVLWNVFNRLPERLFDGILLDDAAKAVLAYVLTIGVATASYYVVERRFFASKSLSSVTAAVTSFRQPSAAAISEKS